MNSRAVRALHAPQPADDAELLSAVAQGDIGALGKLYDRHARAVWAVVHRVMNGGGDVEDVVHATFLKVPALAARFDGRASARNWLIGISVRTALRHLRGLGRWRRILGRFAETQTPADLRDPETYAQSRSELALVDRKLDRLSLAKRAVFILVEVEGLSQDEVARELGIPIATVRTRLFHAKRELIAALEKGTR